jgi:ribonuclease VapC
VAAEVVADTSAVFACAAGEPGSHRLREYDLVHVCAVNHAEIITNMIRWGYDEATIDAALRNAPYRIHAFDAYRADVSARLCRDPHARRLSLGDRACLSLALQTNLPVLTADRAWAALDLGVDVRLIR